MESKRRRIYLLKQFTRKWSILVVSISLVAIIILAGCSTAASSTPGPVQTTTSKPVTSTTAAPPVAATSAPANTTPASSVTLTGAGSTFDNPLFAKWFDVYNGLTGIKVNYQAVGSGTGIQQITAGTVDFGASDGIMTADQQTAAEKAFGPIQHIPVTSGSTAIVYNLPGVPSGTIKLSGPVLADIYLKKVLKWNDPEISQTPPSPWSTALMVPAPPTSSPIIYPRLAMIGAHRSAMLTRSVGRAISVGQEVRE
jgi:phosphate transport system substrate-binding protein